jgi:protein gp37
VGDRTAIEWTNSTWNPITGCTEVSAGCDNCYARTLAHGKLASVYGARLPVVDTPENRADTFAVRLWPERLTQPLRWCRPRVVFVNSMSDFFHVEIPESYQDQMYAVMACSAQHQFQVLTKRPGRAAKYLKALGTPAGFERLEAGARSVGHTLRFEGIPLVRWPVPNVWLGASVENQEAAYRVDHLREAPAAVRFLSCEPLLGPLDLDLTGINWLITGGESGPVHRPCNPDWVRSLRDQCLEAGVAFFHKQWGGRTSKSGGRELDGRTWDEMPQERR